MTVVEIKILIEMGMMEVAAVQVFNMQSMID
jgi:hypothetical protein